MQGKPEVWLLLHILLGIHPGEVASADTCCIYHATTQPTYSCRGCGLSEVPGGIPAEVYALDLSHNNLSSVEDSTFSHLPHLVKLYLNNNQIRQIDQNALTGLSELKELDLRNNQFCVNDTNLLGIFKYTPRLRTLQLVDNKCKETLSVYLNDALSDLKALEKLSLPFIKGADLGPGFKKLRNLKYLMLMGQDSDGGTLGCDAFTSLENAPLEMLSVRNSGLERICKEALKPLKELKYLNLACNRDLSMYDAINVVNYLPQPTLRTMIMDGVGAGELSIEMEWLPFKSAWKNVEKISLRFLNTGHVNLGLLSYLKATPELKYAGLSANMPWVTYDEFDWKEQLIHIFNKTKLETVDLSYYGQQGYEASKFFHQYCHPNNIDEESGLFFRKLPDDIVPPATEQSQDFDLDASTFSGQFFLRNMPLSIQSIYVDFFSFGMIDMFQYQYNPANQILLVNISNSFFFGRFKSLKNVTNVQIIDARNCGFNRLDKRPLHYPSLKKLILSGNSLVNIGTRRKSWSPLKRLKKLQHLDLTNNKISYITTNAFRDLPMLEEIKLAKNELTVLNLDLTGSPNVRLIDVSQNMIKSVSDIFMQSIDCIASKNKIVLDLTGNVLDCSCESLNSIEWLQQSKVRMKQYDDISCDHGSKISTVNTNKIALECFLRRTHLSVVLSTIIPTAFIIIALATVYRKRWKIKFCYYNLKHRLLGRSIGLLTDRDNNDATEVDIEGKHVFISCSDEDGNWLNEEVIRRVKMWGYTTFSRQSDIYPGDDPYTTVVAALDSAAIRMCIISPHFCENALCDFELRMTLAKSEESIIFLYKEKVDPVQHPYISRITNHYNHLEYGECEAKRDQCWEKLREIIRQAVDNSHIAVLG